MLSDEKIYEIINNKLETPINHLKTEVLESEDEICTFFLNNVLNLKTKEKVLLNFRRGLEMFISLPMILTVKSLSTNKIIAVRNDNLLQLLDNRYYSPLQLSSFLDLFAVETNDYKAIYGDNRTNIPHIKLVINYILLHYNTTFRKFMNRNTEYYLMYKFLFDNGEKIKYVLSFLNAYHFSEDSTLYYAELKDFKKEIEEIYEEMIQILYKI